MRCSFPFAYAHVVLLHFHPDTSGPAAVFRRVGPTRMRVPGLMLRSTHCSGSLRKGTAHTIHTSFFPPSTHSDMSLELLKAKTKRVLIGYRRLVVATCVSIHPLQTSWHPTMSRTQSQRAKAHHEKDLPPAIHQFMKNTSTSAYSRKIGQYLNNFANTPFSQQYITTHCRK